MDEDVETMTNIVISAGAPMYGQGKYANLHSAAMIDGPNGEKVRFGFELLTGLSGKPGLSTANKNAFTINGKLHKLQTLDIVEGLNHDGDLENIKIEPRASEHKPEHASCSLSF